LFAQLDCGEAAGSSAAGQQALMVPKASHGTAVVVDLPGTDSIRAAAELAKNGYRPVLINNASPGPLGNSTSSASSPFTTLDMSPLLQEICIQTDRLRRCTPPSDAPPAFILDALRLKGTRAFRVGLLDNRWTIYPQDFPSASFLVERGIRRVLLIQPDEGQPQADLRDILFRWQGAGVEILSKINRTTAEGTRIVIAAPSRLKTFFFRVLAALGWKASRVAGFGLGVSARG
jgi:hypothetical protein